MIPANTVIESKFLTTAPDPEPGARTVPYSKGPRLVKDTGDPMDLWVIRSKKTGHFLGHGSPSYTPQLLNARRFNTRGDAWKVADAFSDTVVKVGSVYGR